VRGEFRDPGVLKDLRRGVSRLYWPEGRRLIPLEQLLSALLLQVFYGIRRELLPME